MYHIGGNSYQLVKDHKNAWNFEVFRERYSEVLDRYDYIVGDWGYNQLRLRGFFKETNNKGSKDASISHLHDYLNEYCNFGCAYFIVEKQPARKGQPDKEREDLETEAAEPVLSSAEPAEAERPLEPASEVKPRQHYHRAGTENRHKTAQERWGDGRGIPNEWKAKTQEAKAKAEEGRGGGEQRSRDRGPQDNRSKDSDNRNRGQEGSRPRHHDGRPRNPENRPRDPEHRQRDNDGRQRDPEQRNQRVADQAHPRDGERRGGGGGGNNGPGRERGQENRGGGKPQVQTHAAGEHKGRNSGPKDQQQGGGRNKPHDHRPRHRDRDRNREADKEKAEPLA